MSGYSPLSEQVEQEENKESLRDLFYKEASRRNYTKRMGGDFMFDCYYKRLLEDPAKQTEK